MNHGTLVFMRSVIQRVSSASVSIDHEIFSKINQGLLILLGIEDADTDEDIEWLVSKILKMRIFDDIDGVMNLSVQDINGEILLLSQFTLYASTTKGNRPSYIKAARPEKAIPMYEKFIELLNQESGKSTKTGKFGAMMQVSLVNEGPVTILIDSKNKQ